MIDEKKSAAASYILTFYREVQTLTSYFAQYTNYILELQYKYTATEQSSSSYIQKANELEKDNIKQTAQNVRSTAIKVYILYDSIVAGIKQESDKTIKELYIKIKNTFILNRGDLENYVLLLNRFLIKGVIQELLESSESLVSGVYEQSNQSTEQQ